MKDGIYRVIRKETSDKKGIQIIRLEGTDEEILCSDEIAKQLSRTRRTVRIKDNHIVGIFQN